MREENNHALLDGFEASFVDKECNIDEQVRFLLEGEPKGVKEA